MHVIHDPFSKFFDQNQLVASPFCNGTCTDLSDSSRGVLDSCLIHPGWGTTTSGFAASSLLGAGLLTSPKQATEGLPELSRGRPAVGMRAGLGDPRPTRVFSHISSLSARCVTVTTGCWIRRRRC